MGWSFRLLTVNNGRSTITVDHDRAGPKAIDLRFADSCDVTGATEVAADVPGARRFERGPIERHRHHPHVVRGVPGRLRDRATQLAQRRAGGAWTR